MIFRKVNVLLFPCVKLSIIFLAKTALKLEQLIFLISALNFESILLISSFRYIMNEQDQAFGGVLYVIFLIHFIHGCVLRFLIFYRMKLDGASNHVKCYSSQLTQVFILPEMARFVIEN